MKLCKFPSITDFEFIKPISKGAFGKVFLGCKKSAPDKLYAIKVMKKAEMVNKNLIKQVIAERDALAVSRSPFVVQLFYSLQSQQNIFLVMEYLIGGDVKSLLAIYGYFDEEMAIMYAAEVTLALEYLHSQGIIHRDLKPDNMLITDQGHIKLTDFGLSKVSLDTVDDILRPPSDQTSKFNMFRTPGQILSLKSSLAFNFPSIRKAKKPALFVTPTATRHKSKIFSPMPFLEKSPSCSPVRTYSTASPLLRMSLTPSHKTITERVTNKPDHVVPPIQSLTPTLQDSLNWTKSETDDSSLLQSLGGREKHRRKSLRKNSSCLVNSQLSDDDVFSSLNGDSEGELCNSHAKAASRQEILSDETPQLHRTDEAVWNSYAARNLRSMREGSYCEDKDPDGEGCKLSDVSYADLSATGLDSSVESGRLTSLSNRGSSNYSYPSDDDESKCSHHSFRHRGRRRQSFELSDDSVLSQQSSVGVQMLGVIQEERMSQGSNSSWSDLEETDDNWREVDGSDLSDCNMSIGQKDERCRLSFKSTSSEDGVELPQTMNTGLTEELCALTFRTRSDRASALPLPSHSGLTQDIKGFSLDSPGCHKSLGRESFSLESGTENQSKQVLDTEVGSACLEFLKSETECSQILQTGLTQEINSLVISSAYKRVLKQESGKLSSDEIFLDVKNVPLQEHLKDSDDPLSKSSGLTQDFGVLCVADKLTVNRQQQFTNMRCRSGSLLDLKMKRTQVKDVLERSRPRKRSFNQVDNVMHDVSKHTEVIGDEHLRKRSNIEVLSKCEFQGGDVRCHDRCNTSSDASSVESSPLIVVSENAESGVLKSPPFSVVVVHNSPDTSQPNLLPSPQAPKLCVHKKELPFSPVPVIGNRKNFMSEDSMFKSPVHQPLALRKSCVCQTRSAHLNSKSSLKDSPLALTPERVAKKKVALVSPLLTPAMKTPFRTPFRGCAQHTPFRTPKSVRRGSVQVEEEGRILGTPDYLAPEILLQKEHGTGVDWWALGVCLFEFLTGIPPFNDQTPELVFENILNRDIPWPEGEEALSVDAMHAIECFLTVDPKQRPNAKDVRKLMLFKSVDWEHVLEKEPAFIPQPDDETDTTYFEARNCMHNLIVSAVDL